MTFKNAKDRVHNLKLRHGSVEEKNQFVILFNLTGLSDETELEPWLEEKVVKIELAACDFDAKNTEALK